ncbi:helix-turn-helix domain-containing protein [Saccharopolyspora flava]|nr:helix-turn-helix transcriptional regulator [Saccharopolyspora flava]
MSDTPRARILAKELRAARAATGMTARELARTLGWSEAKVSRIETARRGIRVEDVEAMLEVLKVRGKERERLVKMAAAVREPAWWEVGRDLPEQLSALIDAESRAKRITDVTLNVLPGLLQTRSYTRAIMESVDLADEEIEERIGIRQMRQGILSRRDPVELRAFIDETALIRPIGGARVMAQQLRQIVSATDEPNISARVLPVSMGVHAGLSGTFVLFEFSRSRPVVYMEARSTGAFIDEPDDVQPFLDSVELLEAQASDSEGSREILNAYVQQYERETE